MRPGPTLRSLVAVILVALVPAGVFVANAATPHDHRDNGPALYNPDCGILALATLGSAAALPENGPAVVVTTVAGDSPAFVPLARCERTAGAASSRAPPRA